MIQALIAALSLVFSLQAKEKSLDWKKGEENNYSISLGVVRGIMQMKVREIAPEGIWLDQKIDLGFAGKEVASLLIDPETGVIKRMIVNGQEQPPPKSDSEVIEAKEDRITVPAGTFDCIHARLKDKEDGSESEMWINPRDIPITGLLKSIQPSSSGSITMQLKNFRKL